MKQIQWKIVIDGDKLIILEETNISLELEGHLTIVGLLEDLKQKHLEKIKTLFQKSVKEKKEDDT